MGWLCLIVKRCDLIACELNSSPEGVTHDPIRLFP